MTAIDPQRPEDVLQKIIIRPGDFVFLEGQEGDSAFVILKGEAQAGSQDPAGNFIVLSRMRAGEMFGEIALVNPDGRRTASVMSEHGCELIVIPRTAFSSRLNRAEPMLTYIIEHLCRRLVVLSRRVITAGLDEPGSPAGQRTAS